MFVGARVRLFVFVCVDVCVRVSLRACVLVCIVVVVVMFVIRVLLCFPLCVVRCWWLVLCSLLCLCFFFLGLLVLRVRFGAYY